MLELSRFTTKVQYCHGWSTTSMYTCYRRRWLKVCFHGYKCYCSPVNTTHQGQAIIVTDAIHHYMLDLSKCDRENRELQEVETAVRRSVWNINNIHAGVDSFKSSEGWHFLQELSEMYKDDILICWNLNTGRRRWSNVGDNTHLVALETTLTGFSLTFLSCDRTTRLATQSTDTDSNNDLGLVQSHLQLNVH